MPEAVANPGESTSICKELKDPPPGVGICTEIAVLPVLAI
jgi:hypothetical protein